jgi:hypothetical protein
MSLPPVGLRFGFRSFSTWLASSAHFDPEIGIDV